MVIYSLVELIEVFLDLFFPLSHILKPRDEIPNFFQLSGELLHEARQRFKEKLF